MGKKTILAQLDDQDQVRVGKSHICDILHTVSSLVENAEDIKTDSKGENYEDFSPLNFLKNFKRLKINSFWG